MPVWCAYLVLYICVFMFGIVIGSFLNVCIYRYPKKESLLKGSHCMECGYHLRWYDLIPLFSFLILRGRCGSAMRVIASYPSWEEDGALYVIVFLANGFNVMSVIYCLLTSALIVLSIIDFRQYIIPDKVNIVILVLGIIATIVDRPQWKEHVIGFFSVSVILLIIYW